MLYDVVFNAEQAVAAYLEEHGVLVSAEAVGLDPRAGMLWVTEDAIVAKDYNVRVLEYYGGFEYVDDEYVSQVGSYKIYFADHERVASCLELFYEENEAA